MLKQDSRTAQTSRNIRFQNKPKTKKQIKMDKIITVKTKDGRVHSFKKAEQQTVMGKVPQPPKQSNKENQTPNR